VLRCPAALSPESFMMNRRVQQDGQSQKSKRCSAAHSHHGSDGCSFGAPIQHIIYICVCIYVERASKRASKRARERERDYVYDYHVFPHICPTCNPAAVTSIVQHMLSSRFVTYCKLADVCHHSANSFCSLLARRSKSHGLWDPSFHM
jgi:hypothetical protein